METVKNADFMNLPEPSEIRAEDEAELLGWPVKMTGRWGVAEGDVPLLIKALGVHRDGVDAEARRNLKLIFGRDLGGKPGPWQGWWRQHLVPGGKRVPCWDRRCAVGT